jgi:hypothetical protein
LGTIVDVNEMAQMNSRKEVVAANINDQSYSAYKRGEVRAATNKAKYSHPLHNANKKTTISACSKDLG